jgi:hypothetical protein
VKGQVHAWIGIVAGGFFGLGYLILNLFFAGGLGRRQQIAGFLLPSLRANTRLFRFRGRP